MSNTLSPPPRPEHGFRRIAILFAGGPAPAANAVISACSAAFLKNDVRVVGIKNGYSNLISFQPGDVLVEGEHYVSLSQQFLTRSRNSQGHHYRYGPGQSGKAGQEPGGPPRPKENAAPSLRLRRA